MGAMERTVAAIAPGRRVALPESVRARIAAERDAGMAAHAIANDLNAEGVPTARNGRWWPSTVAAVLAAIELDAEAERLARTIACDDRRPTRARLVQADAHATIGPGPFNELGDP